MVAEQIEPVPPAPPLYHSPLPSLDDAWVARFWKWVDTSGDGCHEWTGARSKRGYGHLQINRRPWRANRLSWLIHTGDDPGQLQVLHTCDNPPCVRFECLFLGTGGDNMRDMAAKGRATGWRGLTLRGSDNGNSRLTWEKVDQIRSSYAAGGVTQTALAERFEVSQTLISEIVRGKTWQR